MLSLRPVRAKQIAKNGPKTGVDSNLARLKPLLARFLLIAINILYERGSKIAYLSSDGGPGEKNYKCADGMDGEN